MVEHLEQFAALLRKNGVRLSTAEVLDAVRAAALVGVDRGDVLRETLAATLVKRPGDRATFDELYQLYFFRGASLLDKAAGAPLLETLAEAGLSQEALERIAAHLATEAHDLDAVARMGLGMRPPEIAALVQSAGMETEMSRISSPLQVGYYTHRLAERLDMAGAASSVDAVLERLLGAGLSEDDLAVVRQAVGQNLASLRAAVRDYVKSEFERQHVDYFEQLRSESLADKPLAQLSEQETESLRHEVARIARILRARVQLAPKVMRRGRLDLRRTLRRSLATGGVPFDLRRRERRRKKPRLIVLCDISDSVRNVSRFMLQFVYTLQELFDRVHSFVFVAELGETTELFARNELDRAVELANSGAAVNVFANSNYGRMLEQFADRHLSKVTPRTTVLLIGDGRNNYYASNHSILGDVRHRAKQVIWLNPESPASWGFGDSAMREYEPHCDTVAVARNLDSLRKVIDDLVV